MVLQHPRNILIELNSRKRINFCQVVVNTLTSIPGLYRVFGSIPVGRLPGAIKGTFKAIRYYLGG